MRFTIQRLRAGIIAAAALLVAIILGLFFFARYQAHRLIKDLPGRLGLSIQQSTNGFTISRDEKGHTLFTVHASKQVLYKNGGHAQLHDVAITVYGPPGSNRTDRIYGSDFDYDPANNTVTTQGEVQIDLENPGGDQQAGSTPNSSADKAAPDSANPDAQGESAAARSTIHVRTIGLVFNQKTGVATTQKAVEFHFPKAAGNATGAEYDSQQGVLVLDRDVQLSSSVNGNAVEIHASHAQLLRSSHQVFLFNPTCDYQNMHNSSDQGIVYFRQDGSAEHIDAKGHVHIKTDTGENVLSQQAVILMDANSQPTQADMTGGVYFESQDAVHHMRGNAQEGTLRFGPENSLQHAQLRTAVSFVDQVLALPSDPHGSASRTVRGSKVDVDFAPGPDNRAQAQKALATGDAVVVLHTIPGKGPQTNTTISGDQLLATLVNGNAITRLDGTGHTKVVDLGANGATNTSNGDTLLVTFTPPDPSSDGPPKPHAKPGKASRHKQESIDSSASGSQVDTAIQDGHVTIIQTPPATQTPSPAARPAGDQAGTQTAAVPMHAWANRAEYHASDEVLHLEGSPRVNNGSLDVVADHILYHRDSGDANANGNVKATYAQQGSQQPAPAMGGQGPAHVVSDQADLANATGISTFRGHARMWQGTNSVAAPVIELSRPKQTLAAHSDDPKSNAAEVNAAMVTSMGGNHQQAVVRIHSREMFYSDGERKGNFNGTVTAQDPNGTIHSDEAEFFLTPAPPPGRKNAQNVTGVSQQAPAADRKEPAQPASHAAAAGKESGTAQIERMIATGHVVVLQPGRKGVGDKLVYTEQDSNYVLTGSTQNPPKVFDRVHGTVTGASLLFHGQDDSVTVNGGQSGAVTDTRTRR